MRERERERQILKVREATALSRLENKPPHRKGKAAALQRVSCLVAVGKPPCHREKWRKSEKRREGETLIYDFGKCQTINQSKCNVFCSFKKKFKIGKNYPWGRPCCSTKSPETSPKSQHVPRSQRRPGGIPSYPRRIPVP